MRYFRSTSTGKEIKDINTSTTYLKYWPYPRSQPPATPNTPIHPFIYVEDLFFVDSAPLRDGRKLNPHRALSVVVTRG